MSHQFNHNTRAEANDDAATASDDDNDARHPNVLSHSVGACVCMRCAMCDETFKRTAQVIHIIYIDICTVDAATHYCTLHRSFYDYAEAVMHLLENKRKNPRATYSTTLTIHHT